MENPLGSQSLGELARGKETIAIIASDHTRPVPSKLIMLAMLREIRSTNPNARVTILIATGCHRGTTKAEIIFTTSLQMNRTSAKPWPPFCNAVAAIRYPINGKLRFFYAF